MIEVVLKNQLIISDLNYLQHITETSAVVGGGVYADTVTSTTTGKRYATSEAGATAVGDITYTEVSTLTDVKKIGIATVSKADASAKALAKSGYKTASSLSIDKSLSIYITSP